jgi:hypothetical protein
MGTWGDWLDLLRDPIVKNERQSRCRELLLNQSHTKSLSAERPSTNAEACILEQVVLTAAAMVASSTLQSTAEVVGHVLQATGKATRRKTLSTDF